MMYLSPIKRQILTSLRDLEGHASMFDVAAALNEAPFRVRAELLDLKRWRLVREDVTRRRLEWELTPAGEAISWGEQMELGL